MLGSIVNTSLGDDVTQEDRTINSFQEYVASLLGHQDALLVLSGTMGNQVALGTALGAPPNAVLADYRGYIIHLEAGGVSMISGALVKQVVSSNGYHLTLQDVKRDAVVTSDVYNCPTRRVDKTPAPRVTTAETAAETTTQTTGGPVSMVTTAETSTGLPTSTKKSSTETARTEEFSVFETTTDNPTAAESTDPKTTTESVESIEQTITAGPLFTETTLQTTAAASTTTSQEHERGYPCIIHANPGIKLYCACKTPISSKSY
ncbi:unnamed protein product [Fusarium equiseti]|uniref:Aromatic amino acid beta-eliminating lyase/threonine aldolase domain-containing protein n=1 Tax=Fusarium equiseti TaxID=61235 RepID=A0A8J2IQ60_FUSEQ|nr:unnamed protein product [Fusarium equiseti]